MLRAMSSREWSMASLDRLQDLCVRFPAEGRVVAIVLRPEREVPALSVSSAHAVPGRGLLGDRRALRERTEASARRREVTLFQAEHLALLASWSGAAAIDPARVRRNLVIAGVNLIAMRSPFPEVELVWRIGDAVRIEVTGPCDPCSGMEEAFGFGGYNALRGHGGMTARIVTGGELHVGDRVVLDPGS
jgi:MOSC domain-containing protein YiiM